MSTDRATIGGVEIALRARFLDELGEPIEATSVSLYIYDPSVTDFIPANSYAGPLTPTYLGQGVFEYKFTPPQGGPGGVWVDLWDGTVNSASVTANLSFTVGTVGVIEELNEGQLYDNNRVIIDIPGTIKSLNGDSLTGETQFSFLTTLTPYYSSIRKVYLKGGGAFGEIDEETIALSVLEASIETSLLSFATTIGNQSLYEHARREYVTCSAAMNLANNMGTALLKSKTLGDFSVQYDNKGMFDLKSEFTDCMNKWIDQIKTKGNASSLQQPAMVIKGASDPDRITPSRQWVSTAETDSGYRVPAANSVTRNPWSRRYKKTFKKY